MTQPQQRQPNQQGGGNPGAKRDVTQGEKGQAPVQSDRTVVPELDDRDHQQRRDDEEQSSEGLGKPSGRDQ